MDHSFPPSDLYADNLRSGPVPTNAWWENLGKVMWNEMKVYFTTIVESQKLAKIRIYKFEKALLRIIDGRSENFLGLYKRYSSKLHNDTNFTLVILV